MRKHAASNIDGWLLGGQVKTILVSHLQRSDRFEAMDRENLSETAQEAAFNAQPGHVTGARYVVTRDVTGFGRKVVGERQVRSSGEPVRRRSLIAPVPIAPSQSKTICSAFPSTVERFSSVQLLHLQRVPWKQEIY